MTGLALTATERAALEAALAYGEVTARFPGESRMAVVGAADPRTIRRLIVDGLLDSPSFIREMGCIATRPGERLRAALTPAGRDALTPSSAGAAVGARAGAPATKGQKR